MSILVFESVTKTLTTASDVEPHVVFKGCENRKFCLTHMLIEVSTFHSGYHKLQHPAQGESVFSAGIWKGPDYLIMTQKW